MDVGQARLHSPGEESDAHLVEIVTAPFVARNVRPYKFGGDPCHVGAMVTRVFNLLGQRLHLLIKGSLPRFRTRG